MCSELYVKRSDIINYELSDFVSQLRRDCKNRDDMDICTYFLKGYADLTISYQMKLSVQHVIKPLLHPHKVKMAKHLYAKGYKIPVICDVLLYSRGTVYHILNEEVHTRKDTLSEQITQLYFSGYTVDEIAQAVKCSRNTVYSYAPGKFSGGYRIFNLLEKGLTVTEIVEQLGCARSTVYKYKNERLLNKAKERSLCGDVC